MKASAKLGEERNRKVGDAQAVAIEDLRVLLTLPEGKRVLWRLLSACQVYETPFNPNGSIQAQNIGRQDVGRQLISWMAEVDPIAYPQLCIDMGRRDKEDET